MATVKDLYTQEGAKLGKVETTLTADFPDHRKVEILGTTLFHDELAAYYRAFYLDAPPAHGLARLLVSLMDAEKFHHGFSIHDSHPAQFGFLTNDHLVASRNTILYVNGNMDETDVAGVLAGYAARGQNAIIRDARFAKYITTHERPAAFVSHDSRDKDAFARPLVDKLAAHSVPVWYDEYSIKVGDGIYESIERGLKIASKVVILLSKNFFANKSWARQEFVMAIQRHISEKVILPVWIDVDVDDVKRYDLTLAGLKALQWSTGVDHVARTLANAIVSE